MTSVRNWPGFIITLSLMFCRGVVYATVTVVHTCQSEPVLLSIHCVTIGARQNHVFASSVANEKLYQQANDNAVCSLALAITMLLAHLDARNTVFSITLSR